MIGDRIHRAQLRDAIDSLTTVGANLQGLVLNKIARRDSSAYVYDSGYAQHQEGWSTSAAAVGSEGQPAEQGVWEPANSQ